MTHLGITGSPGTGKKTIAPLVASNLHVPLVDLNAFAKKGSRGNPGSTTEVDTVRFRKMLVPTLPSECVISGHLLPDVLRKGELDFVAVLRCEPSVLKRRLVKRGYARQKLIENLEAELIGVVLDQSLRAFGKRVVHEYDSTSTDAARIAENIASDYRLGNRSTGEWTDWTVRYTSSARLRSLLFSFGSTEAAST